MRDFPSWKDAGRHLRSHQVKEGVQGKRKILPKGDGFYLSRYFNESENLAFTAVIDNIKCSELPN